ncbi:MAG: hypothetical protein K9I92_08640 [Chitinophagaceae bacterium]|nr:hypothetical protein [Chitinophagaceae bacterium]
MLKKCSFLLLLIFGYGPFSLGQGMPPILKKLSSHKGPVLVYSQHQQALVDLSGLPLIFTISGYNLIKDASGLYVLPQGTGRIYKMDTSQRSYRWQRIDSTFFTGYNFSSIAFGLDSVFYSFGGNGFWNTNGTLRNFNFFSKQWDATMLSENIYWHKAADGFFLLDTASKTLSIKAISAPSHDVLKSSKDEKIKEGLYRLNIKTGDWTKMGNMRDTSHSIMATLPWGLLVDNFGVLDLATNRYFTLSKRLKSKILGIVSSSRYIYPAIASFAIDSVFYIGNQFDPYDSVVISRADLTDTGIPIYTPLKPAGLLDNIKTESFLLVTLGFLSSFLGLLLYKAKKAQPTPAVESLSTPINSTKAVATPESEKHPTSFRSTRILELLEERERSLLEFLFSHSEDERLTTIEEINKVVGVQNRSVEIQKRMRSDLIGSINQKLSIVTRDKQPVVDKQRSEFDKRSFEYFIHPTHMELVEKIIRKK